MRGVRAGIGKRPTETCGPLSEASRERDGLLPDVFGRAAAGAGSTGPDDWNSGPRIVIFGHLGQGNVGDELMFEAIIAVLRERFPRAVFTVLAGDLYDRRLFAAEHMRRKARTFRHLLASLRSNDILVIPGGTHLHTRREAPRYVRAVLRHMMIYILARAAGLKVWLIGVGIGPFETLSGRILGRLAVNAATFISVRDRESAVWMTRFRVPSGRFVSCQDPACYLNLPGRSCTRAHLGISVMRYFGLYSKTPERDAHLADRFKDVIGNWFRAFPDSVVSLIAFYSGSEIEGDAALARQIKAEWSDDPRVRLIDPRGRNDICVEAFRHFTHFISMRYHSQVLATLYGIPQVVIGYHEKNYAFAAASGLPQEAILSVDEFLAGKGFVAANLLFSGQIAACPGPSVTACELLPPREVRRA